MVEKAARLLHYNQSGSGDPLVILHGLFGSSKNWQSLARQFAENYTVYNIDLRNHGSSFHDAAMDYRVMSEDVSGLLRHLGLQTCYLLGHSMGGKVAMTLAASGSELIDKMIIADIAPVAYSRNYDNLIDPILSISLSGISRRNEVDDILANSISDPMLRGFLMQNLYRDGDEWQWRVNWSAIKQHMNSLFDFPMSSNYWQIHVPTLFIRGENSEYVTSDGIDVIDNHFSHVRVETLENAGHWLHADQPQAFLQHVLTFLR